MTKIFFLFLTILNLSSTLIYPQYEYDFGTTKIDIERNHTFSLFINGELNKNILYFLGEEEYYKIKYYLIDDAKYDSYCNLDYITILGFYNDSLFSIIRSTKELPKDIETNVQCQNSTFFDTDSTPMTLLVMKSSPYTGGNIFGEAGFVVINNYQDKYIVELISYGIHFLKPSHKQFTFISLSKTVLDALEPKLIVHSDNRKHISPFELFVYSLHDTFEKYQNPF